MEQAAQVQLPFGYEEDVHFLSRIAVSQHCSMSRWPLRALRLAPIDLQVDEWILAFVELLKEHCGIDPDKPLEVQEVSGGSVAHLHYTPPSTTMLF